MNTEELVAMYEDNRKGRLNEVVHEYLNDGACTSEIFVGDLKSIFEGHAAHKAEEARVAQEAALAASEAQAKAASELADKVEEQNAAQFDADQAAQSIHWIDDSVTAAAGTAFDAPEYYATATPVNVDTSIYPPDHPYHIDTSVAAGSTAAYPTGTYNVDTTTYGDVSIASSEANPTGYYDEPNNVDPQTPETYPVPEPAYDPLAVPSKFDNHH